MEEKEWPYAWLSKLAKVNGGPEKLIDTIMKMGEQEGIKKAGKKNSLIGGLIGSGVTLAVVQIYNHFKSKKKVSYEEFENAKQELIDGINQYDSEHNSSDSSDIDDDCSSDSVPSDDENKKTD